MCVDRKWDVDHTDDGRVFVEYQGFDRSEHTDVDIRLYLDGNFNGIKHKLRYAEKIKNMLNEVMPDADL